MLNLKAMKTRIFLMIISIVLAWSNLNQAMVPGQDEMTPKGSLTVYSAPDIRDLSGKWADEYHKVNPEVNVQLVSYPATGALTQGTDIGFITDEYAGVMQNENLWKMVVGHDAIVPVINSENPFRSVISHSGITSGKMALLITEPGKQQWGELSGNGETSPVHVYMVNDISMISRVEKYLGIVSGSENIRMVQHGTELLDAVRTDPYALGFCRLTDVADLKSGCIAAGIALMPIDKNGNGNLDNFENIYDNLPDFMRGVWIGKYPASLTSNIYAVSSAKPQDEIRVGFLKWVLDGGQQFLNPTGYSELGYSEREAKSALLSNKPDLAALEEKSTSYQSVMTLLVIFLVSVLIIVWILGYRRNVKQGAADVLSSSARFNRFTEPSVMVPKGLWFDKSHTWVFMEQNGMVRIGVDDFLQHITGPLTRVILKNQGEHIRKGEVILIIIQNGKQLKISSPVSGTIRQQNDLLHARASLINDSPFTEGWVYTIEPSYWMRETEFLFMSDKYREWLKHEFSRLRDFFATSVRTGSREYATVVLQDGGELKDNLLSGFGPDVWEEFQEKFIDASK